VTTTERRSRTCIAGSDGNADAGMTLPEVLVAMGLFALLTTLLTSTAIMGLRTASGLEGRLDNVSQGQLGIAAVSKVLRTAVLPDQLDEQTCVGCADTAIVQATTTQVSFYANLDNVGQGPSLVTLRVLPDPGATNGTAMLQQSTIPPTTLADGRYTYCAPGTPGCVVNTRVLTRGLGPGVAVFGYYDFDGSPILSSSLSNDDLPRVASVDVVLSVQTKPDQDAYPATTVVQRVRLPNADINVLVQPSGA
jgi:prepilin-type N-terminal cleavage/methylation domain-containing protein